MHRSARPQALLSSLLALVVVAGSAGVLAACGSDEPEAVGQRAPSGAPSPYAPPPPPGGQAGSSGEWPAPPPPGGGAQPGAGGVQAAGGAGDPFSGRFQARAEGVVYDLELARHDQERWAGTLSYGGNRIPIVGVLQGGKLVGLVNDPAEGEYGFWGSASPNGLLFEIEDDEPVAFQRVGKSQP